MKLTWVFSHHPAYSLFQLSSESSDPKVEVPQECQALALPLAWASDPHYSLASNPVSGLISFCCQTDTLDESWIWVITPPVWSC